MSYFDTSIDGLDLAVLEFMMRVAAIWIVLREEYVAISLNCCVKHARLYAHSDDVLQRLNSYNK